MEYQAGQIEDKWQKIWRENKVYQADNQSDLPKYYVLDMFPYPSGAGLHVGHPLGYIASDIYARYKRNKGFNVLHPMGYDSFGLPAEQYAIQTGQHPAITTEQNINRYREQLDKLGFSFDWSREVRTSDAKYYKWTQWIFIQIFNSWFDNDLKKARNIDELNAVFEKEGNENVNAVMSENWHLEAWVKDAGLNINERGIFGADAWKSMSEKAQYQVLMNYRLTYLSETWVNWCPKLGTVLANEEVKDGLSERGGYPVERKLMKQWSMRITAYAERLLQDLDSIDWSESIKEQQKNWIGKSVGAKVFFPLKNSDEKIEVFTTRPDTIFGVSFMVVAPESELVQKITTDEQRKSVNDYVEATAKRSERDRMSEIKRVSGVFTGAYAIHPVNGKEIPVWTGDYVLAGYGTGAVMAVPAHDSRDYAFAKYFNLPILQVIANENGVEEAAHEAKEGTMINSDFLNGLNVKDAIEKASEYLKEHNLGEKKINYRLRDAIFSRQRYWGEPFPVYYKDELPYIDENLPLELPEVDAYLPTEDGEPPLARAKDFKNKDGFPYETNTMPGWAGSSWYFLRYMDANNEEEFASEKALDYWKDVDLYVGGAEHATGHLLYARFWNKFLFDLGFVKVQEPFKKLINQGMIQGRSNFVYYNPSDKKYYSKNLAAAKEKEMTEKAVDQVKNVWKSKIDAEELKKKVQDALNDSNLKMRAIHVDVSIVKVNDELNIDKFKAWRKEFENAEFVLEDGKYICGWEVEKMSKSKFNVVNPDDLVAQYGADTLRMYEMFLGPVEQSKPWNTNGIEGVSKFLKKFWRLFFDQDGNWSISTEKANEEELRILHKTIKKIDEDIQNFSFNTSVSSFMICVNELSKINCNKKEILEPLVVLISPFAPHFAEELWEKLGNTSTVTKAPFPIFEEKFIAENKHRYPVSFNGKTRFFVEFPLDKSANEIIEEVLKDEQTQKWLEGKQAKKTIVVPGKIINFVM
jgi:leucyl-tRNA synthetase